MVKRTCAVLVTALAFAVFSAPALADVVELKAGQRVDGTVKLADAKVSVDISGQTVTFDQDKVRAIYFGSAPTPPDCGSSTPPRQKRQSR